MVEPLKIVSLSVDASPGDMFSASRAAAIEAVEEWKTDALLVSWKNNLTGESFPVVESCRCGMEGWELYAVSRGAALRVEINGGQLVFLFVPFGTEKVNQEADDAR